MNGNRVHGSISRTSERASLHVTKSRSRDTGIGRVLGLAIEVAFIVAVALAVLVALGLVGNPWYHIVSINGGSMAPTIGRGDLIVVTTAPARIEPSMIVVLSVGDQVVTHRVVAVNADGTFVTRGDANPVNDDWGGQQVRVVGVYVATIPWLGHVVSAPDVSTAAFVDRVGAAMTITVGSWPTPHLAATVRIQPQAIDLKDKGDVTAFVDGLPDPYSLEQVDLTSVELCFQGVCASSDGPATFEGGQVAATFACSALAGVMGTDRGDLVLVVQGSLTDGSTFSGQDNNRVSSASDVVVAPLPPAVTPVPTSSPGVTKTATPTSSPHATDMPAPTPTSSPDATATPTPAPSPDPTATPTPTPTASPDANSGPTRTPSPDGTPAAP